MAACSDVGSPGSVRAVEPRPQLALLAPGEARHPARVVAALDQHERLQHRVVEVGGDARPARPRGCASPAPRRASAGGGRGPARRTSPGRRRRRRSRSADGADVGQPAGAVGERDDAGAEQHDAGDDLERPRPSHASGRGGRGSRRRIHDDDDADGDGGGGEHDAVARPQADRPGGDEDRRGRASDGQLAATVRGAARSRRRRRSARRRRGERGEAVQHGADAAGEGQQARSRRARPSARRPNGRPSHRRRRRRSGRCCAARAGRSRRSAMVGIVAHHDPAAASGSSRPGGSGTDQGHPRWRRAARVRTVGAVDLAAPPPAPDPTPLPERRPAGQRPPDSRRRRGSSAASPPSSATRLGVDPLWVRIGFVLLALAGGIGVLLYAGLWLVLIAGRSSGRALAALGAAPSSARDPAADPQRRRASS